MLIPIWKGFFLFDKKKLVYITNENVRDLTTQISASVFWFQPWWAPLNILCFLLLSLGQVKVFARLLTDLNEHHCLII